MLRTAMIQMPINSCHNPQRAQVELLHHETLVLKANTHFRESKTLLRINLGSAGVAFIDTGRKNAFDLLVESGGLALDAAAKKMVSN